jgi:ABC-2 type transport system permease protein
VSARWLVARRELTERARSRALRIATLLQLGLIVAVLVISALAGGDEDTKTVGLVGSSSQAFAQPLRASGPALGVTLRIRTLPSRAAAERGVDDGDLDAAVVDGDEVLVEHDRTDTLTAAVQAVRRQLALRGALERAGVPPRQLAQALSPPALRVRAIDPQPADQDTRSGLAIVAVILLYIAIITYGMAVAGGIVEEKASRVIEVVLSAIRPRELLFGKIAGLGALALVQFALTIGVGVGAALALNVAELPSVTGGAAALVVAWFLAGFLLYACLYSIAGALVSRSEDLQSAAGPLNVVTVACYLVAFFGVGSPDSELSVVASFVPLSAPMAMPVRWLVGDVPGWQVAVSFALTLLTAFAIMRLSAAIYAGTALRLGPRLSLRRALAVRS